MSQTRRDFLKSSLGASTLLSLGSVVPAFLRRSALAAPLKRDAGESVLVVVQLSGGNDGLNTVVPYGDDNYARNRRTLRLPASQLHKIDSLLGFHPRMQAFLKLYKEGHLSVVQGVGYPNSDRTHDRAKEIWHSAQPEQTNPQTGWLGRAVDGAGRQEDAGLSAVFLGEGTPPFSLTAEKVVVPSFRSIRQCQLHAPPGPEGGRAHRQRLAKAAALPRAGNANSLLKYVQRRTLAAYAGSRRVEALVQAATKSTGEYPPLRLAQVLKVIAQFIRADLGIRIYYAELGGLELGGFDSHANQLGNHAALLGQLSESVAAFVEDLGQAKLLDRMLLMTCSEFGRMVRENGRRGTDHGAAAPMFLAGGKLKGGLVGPHPSLTDLDNGALKFHTDFRRVYATVLDRWLGFDSQNVLSPKFEPLDLFEG